MEFELGQTYSGYEFLQLVRSSRSAQEYRVRNVLAEREETLKALPAAAEGNRDAADAFLREARILARVSHPHIVSFYSAQPIDGRMVMTTEWSGFEPLTARLRSGPLPWREAVNAARPAVFRLGLPARVEYRAPRHHAREHHVAGGRVETG